MAQLRTALRAYAVEGHAPAAVVDRVNRLMRSLGPLAMTTLATAGASTRRRRRSSSSAPAIRRRSSSIPPARRRTSGRAAASPLGASATATYASETVPLPTGSTVLLYTDGLVERRGAADRRRARAAARCVAEGTAGRRAPCAARSSTELVPEAPGDDVAFVAARVPPLGDDLTTRWAGDARQPRRRSATCCAAGCWRTARRRTRRTTSPSPHRRRAPTPSSTPTARAARSSDSTLAYADGRVTHHGHATSGRWRPPRGSNRGRGLPLMHELMDTVDVAHDGGAAPP